MFKFFDQPEWPLNARSVFIGDQDDVIHLKALLDIAPFVSDLKFEKVLADESLKDLVCDVLNHLQSATTDVVCFSCWLAAFAS